MSLEERWSDFITLSGMPWLKPGLDAYVLLRGAFLAGYAAAMARVSASYHVEGEMRIAAEEIRDAQQELADSSN